MILQLNYQLHKLIVNFRSKKNTLKHFHMVDLKSSFYVNHHFFLRDNQVFKIYYLISYNLLSQENH